MAYITSLNGGSYEVFFWSLAEAELEDPKNWDLMALPNDTKPEDRVGWYWHACFPGCLPDGDAMGPFDSEESAAADALEVYE